ncbi:MAG: hypothetical protein QOG67_2251 [Verrucomicrobiota bacterium]
MPPIIAAGLLGRRLTILVGLLLRKNRSQKAGVGDHPARSSGVQRSAIQTDSLLEPQADPGALRSPLRRGFAPPKAKHSRQQLKGQLTTMTEPATDCVITVDAQNKILEFNVGAQRTLGYRQKDVIGRPLTESIIRLSQCKNHHETAGTPLTTNRTLPGKRIGASAVRGDGSEFPVELTMTQIRGQRPPIYTAYLRDMTRPMAAQTRLKESQAESPSLFDDRIRAQAQLSEHIAHIGSWSRDLLTGKVTWSEEMYRMFGLSPASFAPTYNAGGEFIRPKQRGAFRAGTSIAFETLQPYDRFHRIMGWDGTQRILHHHIAVETDAAGKLIRVFGTAQDVTEAKEAEEKIRKQASLLDLACDAIMVRDMDDRVEFWNEGATRIYGWTSDEMLGKRACEFLYEGGGASILEIRGAVVEHGQWSGECQHVCKDGHNVSIRSRWTLVRDEDGQPNAQLVINTNITEQKRLEGQFLRVQRLESIGTLASGVAHDLNNILAPILISAPLLRGDISQKDKEKLVTIVESSAERGAGIVKQVLTFARGAEGDRVLLRPNYLLEEMAKIARETFPRSITVITHYPETLRTLEADPIQLHQVLLNLCINARDAMPTGGTLTLVGENIDVGGENAGLMSGGRSGPYVVLQVSDSGSGISPHVIDKIFDPFFTTKDVGVGTGLGLSTVVGIVKNHRGFMNVTSEAGHTRFRIFLPATERAVMPRKALLSVQGEE